MLRKFERTALKKGKTSNHNEKKKKKNGITGRNLKGMLHLLLQRLDEESYQAFM